MGKIGTALQTVKVEGTALQVEIGRLIRHVAILGVSLGVLVAVLYGLTRDSWLNACLAGITAAKEQATARYQEKLDQLEAVRRAMKAGSNRMRGAAVARLFSRIVVRFDQTRKRGGWLPDETEFHLWHVKEAVRHALIDQLTEVEEEFLHLGDVKRLIAESDIPGLSVDAEDEKSQGKPSDRSGSSAGRRRSCWSTPSATWRKPRTITRTWPSHGARSG